MNWIDEMERKSKCTNGVEVVLSVIATKSLSSSDGLDAKGDSTKCRTIADFASGATGTSNAQAVFAPALHPILHKRYLLVRLTLHQPKGGGLCASEGVTNPNQRSHVSESVLASTVQEPSNHFTAATG